MTKLKHKMGKNRFFCILFVATTIVLLASCSQDDDYYESDMYTLAERGTRLGDPEPGGDDSNMYLRGGSKEANIWVDGLHVYFDVSWGEGRWDQVRPHLTYKRCDNCSGYYKYRDSMNIERKIHTFKYVGYNTNEGPKVHFDEIIISDFNNNNVRLHYSTIAILRSERLRISESKPPPTSVTSLPLEPTRLGFQ